MIMSLPEAMRVELPILQELEAVGGRDHVRYLYDRLVRYFPQWTPEAIEHQLELERRRWQSLIQRAGRQLADKGELRRDRTLWELTARGRRRLEAEAMPWGLPEPALEAPVRQRTHLELQRMLIDIGGMLGKHAEAEFEHYDVVWRDAPTSPRQSHVFEVQVAGSVDSALTRLKHAFDTQRSMPFLVVADERSAGFAARRLAGPFYELWSAVTVIGVGELEQLHRALSAQGGLLQKMIARG
jgi:hypothetical protein